MSTRKRKHDDEELVALPSDESEEEEEYVCTRIPSQYHCISLAELQLGLMQLLRPLETSISMKYSR